MELSYAFKLEEACVREGRGHVTREGEMLFDHSDYTHLPVTTRRTNRIFRYETRPRVRPSARNRMEVRLLVADVHFFVLFVQKHHYAIVALSGRHLVCC